MKSVLRICFYAILASLAVISISCGEDTAPTPTPAPTNTELDATNVNTLVGNYKIMSFDGLGLVKSDNYTQVQEIIGQGTINIEGGKLILRVKAQIDSLTIRDLASIGDPFAFINTDNLPPLPIDTTANADGSFGSITDTDKEGLIIEVDNTTQITATQGIKINPAIGFISATFVLAKVNDAVIDLQKDKKYWNVAPMNTKDTITSMATLLSYYSIDNITYPDGSKTTANEAIVAPNFAGNLQIKLNTAVLEKTGIDFIYKFQDALTTDHIGYTFGTANLPVGIDDIKDIPAAFARAGAEISDDKMHLTITFKPTADNFTHELDIDAGKTLTMNLTKLYDQDPALIYLKKVIDKKYWETAP